MAGSLNRVTLIGNLGRDPDIRSTQQGTRIANFSVACSESWKDKNSGERKERTEWINCVIFNEGLVTIAEKYLKKGSKVFIEGKMATRKWTDQSGQDRYSTEVVLQNFAGQLILLGEPGGGRRAPNSPDDYGSGADAGYSDHGGGSTGPLPDRFKNDLDDDIPF